MVLLCETFKKHYQDKRKMVFVYGIMESFVCLICMTSANQTSGDAIRPVQIFTYVVLDFLKNVDQGVLVTCRSEMQLICVFS